MAKEAIELVKQAEERAAELVREAEKAAADMLLAAGKAANDELEKEKALAADALAGLEKRAHMDEAQTIAAAAAELDAACAEAKNAILNKKEDIISRIIEEIKAG